jgi:exopolyphosphatase/guanosine-5'-triphosphate,3'-diphosphate pyrophosphatase
MPGPDPKTVLAAVDLGSNSFHMIVARLDRGVPVVIDKIRENVRLASGLDAAKNLSPEAQERALDCLDRFGERLRDLPEDCVRVVGTNTLRKAKNRRQFLASARRALDHDIEVISGREEARLIYLGVAHSIDHDSARRLVVDIGGGSTELIVGERFDPLESDSMQMGCVRYTQKFFGDGVISRGAMEKARLAARLELRSVEQHYRSLGWEQALGASGTIRAIDAILRASGLASDAITAEGLASLRDRVVAAGHVDRLDLPELNADRRPVLAGGLAVLSGIFDALELDRMIASSGALREGLLYDLLGRIRSEDVRDQTIDAFQSRYNVDRGFAAELQVTVLELFDQGAEAWGLDRASGRQFLSWATQLHEIGLSVSHAGYHRHGAYLIQHSDMRGFSQDDQELLAAVVLGHRRRLRRERLLTIVAERRVDIALRLAFFLRVARRLHRSRGRRAIPVIQAEFEVDSVCLRLPQDWLAENPLTRADLEDEATVLAGAGIQLTIA